MYQKKGLATFAIIMIVVIAFVVGGFLFASKRSVSVDDAMIKSDGVATEETISDAMAEEKMTEGYDGTVLAGTTAPLLDFTKADYNAAVQSGKLVVLYFYANWCPICKQEVADALYPAFNDLTTDRVVGFRVNFNDNETDDDEKNLAREFGIAYQHTKVFVKDDTRLLKSPEKWDRTRYAEEISKFIER